LPGDGVDIVTDAGTWEPVFSDGVSEDGYDLILSTETFEHAQNWEDIIATAYKALRPGGMFIFTCAGPGRPAHSGVAAVWELSPGEWYSNVSAGEIAYVLKEQGWHDIEVRQIGLDTQGRASKPVEVPIRTAEPREVLFGAALSRTSQGASGSPGRS
jgi:predicted TPR repeat methyltransferase